MYSSKNGGSVRTSRESGGARVKDEQGRDVTGSPRALGGEIDLALGLLSLASAAPRAIVSLSISLSPSLGTSVDARAIRRT